jgi:hypothetical protein
VLLRNSELAKLHRSSYSVLTISLLVSLNISSRTSHQTCHLGASQRLKRSTPKRVSLRRKLEKHKQSETIIKRSMDPGRFYLLFFIEVHERKLG